MKVTVKKVGFLIWEWWFFVDGKYVAGDLTMTRRGAIRAGNKYMNQYKESNEV